MAEAQDSQRDNGTVEQRGDDVSGVQAQFSTQESGGSSETQVVQSRSNQETPESQPLQTQLDTSIVQSVYAATDVPVAENGGSTAQEARPPSRTTTIGHLSRANSNAVTQTSTPVQHAPTQQSISRPLALHPRDKTFSSKLLSLKYLLGAAIVVGLTASFMFTTNYQYSPLGSLSANSGILILNLLGKGTDYTLLAAAAKLWTTLQWGPLLRRGEPLLTFLTLSSGTGVTSWLRILGSRRSRDGRYPDGGQTGFWAGPRVWSFIRLVAWVVLQFPGIIVLAVASPQTDYYPSNYTVVSGGIGVFDPMLAARGTFSSSTLAGLITTSILRDTTRTFQVDPVSEQCIAAGDNCTSYLVPGGLISVSPWPFQQTDEKYMFYLTKDEPSYHIDFWTPQGPIQWSDGSCIVYGPTSTALKLCVDSSKTGEGQITAGWRYCANDVTSITDCPYAGSSESVTMETVSIAIYRRKASITASRTTFTILRASDLQPPILQPIPPASFHTTFASIFSPWSSTPSDNFCATQTPQYDLTTFLAARLQVATLAPFTPLAADTLRNLFATVLYLYTPLISGAVQAFVIDTVTPGLPEENYFSGSIAVGVEHLVPARWTAYAYAVVGAAVLALVLVVMVMSGTEGMLESSGFEAVDVAAVGFVVRGEEGEELLVRGLGDVFGGVEVLDEEAVVREAGNVVVALGGRGVNAGAGAGSPA